MPRFIFGLGIRIWGTMIIFWGLGVIHKTKLELRVGSLPKVNFLYLLENDFNVPVVHYVSNFTGTLFICVRFSDMMFYFFLPLQLQKRRTPFF